MFFELFEEILNSLGDSDKSILACNNILCRLYGVCIRSLQEKETQDYSYRKDDTSTSKNDIRG